MDFSFEKFKLLGEKVLFIIWWGHVHMGGKKVGLGETLWLEKLGEGPNGGRKFLRRRNPLGHHGDGISNKINNKIPFKNLQKPRI